MAKILTEVEVRIVGSLIEKQITTPEYYPLTLNALTAACNQRNSRDPVMTLAEEGVTEALETLREKNLVYVFYGSTSRVPKYKHMTAEVFHLTPRELAVLCVLLLRGPQTVGELKDRGQRLAEFAGADEVEEALASLAANEMQPLVVKLPRQLGQKEARFAHLLAGDVAAAAPPLREDRPAVRRDPAGSERIAELEGEVRALREELGDLRQRFDEFRRQFE